MADANTQEERQQEESLLEVGNGLFLPSLGGMASAANNFITVKNVGDPGLLILTAAAVTTYTMWHMQSELADTSLSAKLIATCAVGMMVHGGVKSAGIELSKNHHKRWHAEAPASAQ